MSDLHRRRWMRIRIALLGVAIGALALAVVHRAYQLGVARGPELGKLVDDQVRRSVRLAPKRGTVYDRNGAELAVSVEADSVYANPRELARLGGSPERTADLLATVLGVERDRIAKRLGSDRLFVWIERHVTPALAARVDALRLPGVYVTREAKRYYPNRELAAHVLGFADIDGKGIEGIELTFEDRLRGDSGSVPAIRDRRGAVVFSEHLLDDRAAHGDELVLTLDKTIQHATERELALAVQTFEAKGGSAVVLDPSTGEVLALANYPWFNPNDPGHAPASHRRNRAVTDRFEPGSTVKPFTVAAALAAGTIRSTDVVDCEDGAMRVAEYTIHDTHRYEDLSITQVLAYSSNIGTAKIGATLGRPGLYRGLRRFGFGELTGIELPGETAGILRHYKRWYDMDAATVSFGQGMSVTTLQLAVATAALANGGRVVRPRVVRRVIDGEGRTLEEFEPEIRREATPPGVARILGRMLTEVVTPDATGFEAGIEGYRVAGKTGTAQKADYVGGGYSRDRWTSSFVGFVPAERPRVVIAVVIDEPVIAHYGGDVAGPVFRRVGATALRQLGVPPMQADADLERLVAARGRQAGESVVARDGEAWSAGGPEPTPASAAPSAPAPPGYVEVPRLAGLGARGAIVRLASLGLVPLVDGSGRVVAQAPPSGSAVPRGTPVRIALADDPNRDPLPEDGASMVAAARAVPGARSPEGVRP